MAGRAQSDQLGNGLLIFGRQRGHSTQPLTRTYSVRGPPPCTVGPWVGITHGFIVIDKYNKIHPIFAQCFCGNALLPRNLLTLVFATARMRSKPAANAPKPFHATGGARDATSLTVGSLEQMMATSGGLPGCARFAAVAMLLASVAISTAGERKVLTI